MNHFETEEINGVFIKCSIRKLKNTALHFFLIKEKTYIEKAASSPKPQSFETSFHHITMLSLSRIPWGKKCKKTSLFPASLCQRLLMTK